MKKTKAWAKKTIKAWAVVNREGGIETFNDQMPIFWFRRGAEIKAKNDSDRIAKITITIPPPKRVER
jgi:hypothetical protein